jgi:hypothetical protein
VAVYVSKQRGLGRLLAGERDRAVELGAQPISARKADKIERQQAG